MTDQIRNFGQTSNCIRFKLRKASDGNGFTGLDSASSGLVISTITNVETSAVEYTGSNIQTIATVGTFVAPSTDKCRFGDADSRGTYEIQLDDVRFAVTDAVELRITVLGVADLLDREIVIRLAPATAVDFTTDDSTKIGELRAKLPSKPYLAGSDNSTGTLPYIIELGTVTAVYSATTFDISASLSGLPALTGRLIILNNGDGKVYRKIVSVDDPTITIDASYSPDTGEVVQVLVAPEELQTALADIVALQAAVANIQNNTFVSSDIPQILAIPGSGSVAVPFTIYFADETGAATNLDSGNPAIALTNDAGTDLSGRIGSWSNPATGKYVNSYTNDASDDTEGLHWDVTGTVNSTLRRYVAYTQLTAVVATNFTTDDRDKLVALYGEISSLEAVFQKLPSKPYLAGSDNSTGTLPYILELGTVTAALSPFTINVSNPASQDIIGNKLIIFNNGDSKTFRRVVSVDPPTITIDEAYSSDVDEVVQVLVGPRELDEVIAKVAAIFAKLPTKPYLPGTIYADGSAEATAPQNLAEALAAALSGSEIEFTDETLDTFRDHLTGGKLWIGSRVNISAVTPTKTKFAGHDELSAVTGFYSDTNSVLAFISGNLQGLCGLIVAYDGPSRTFFFDAEWPTPPAAEDKFVLLGKIAQT